MQKTTAVSAAKSSWEETKPTTKNVVSKIAKFVSKITFAQNASQDTLCLTKTVPTNVLNAIMKIVQNAKTTLDIARPVFMDTPCISQNKSANCLSSQIVNLSSTEDARPVTMDTKSQPTSPAKTTAKFPIVNCARTTNPAQNASLALSWLMQTQPWAALKTSAKFKTVLHATPKASVSHAKAATPWRKTPAWWDATSRTVRLVHKPKTSAQNATTEWHSISTATSVSQPLYPTATKPTWPNIAQSAKTDTQNQTAGNNAIRSVPLTTAKPAKLDSPTNAPSARMDTHWRPPQANPSPSVKKIPATLPTAPFATKLVIPVSSAWINIMSGIGAQGPAAFTLASWKTAKNAWLVLKNVKSVWKA